MLLMLLLRGTQVLVLARAASACAHQFRPHKVGKGSYECLCFVFDGMSHSCAVWMLVSFMRVEWTEAVRARKREE
jgi:hypothetical protein